LVSSILFPIAQQLSGINAVFYYSTQLFDGVIANPKVGTIVAFAVNVVATVFALLLMDKLGRKTLLAWSAGGMGICCIFLTLSLLGILPPIMTVLCVMLYISFFELGLGCIPFFLSSELIQPQFLGTVQSISMACNWFFNFCVGLLFPYMDQILGAYSFVPFGIVLLGTVWYALWILPETRGKSLEMVMEELRDTRHPQRIAQDEPPETTPSSLPMDGLHRRPAREIS
jgi:MFS family permease